MPDPAVPPDPTLADIVEQFRTNPALAQKAAIAMVRDVLGAGDWLSGPGDDGAVVDTGYGPVVVCGEALFPPFVARDPYGAGIAAVLTNVNDVAAMGARPTAIVDTVTGSEAQCRAVLEGLRYASDLYKVPIVGGHLTVTDGPPSVSAFALGTGGRQGRFVPLTSAAARPGQRLALLACLEGEMRDDFPFFASFAQRGARLGDDVRLLAELADSALVVAAKDVSMAGLLGSLAMLLEPSRCGVTVALGTIPRPPGVDLGRWLMAFPCFAFLLCVSDERAEECRAVAGRHRLTYAELGVLDDSGLLAITDGSATVTVTDIGRNDITGLRPR